MPQLCNCGSVLGVTIADDAELGDITVKAVELGEKISVIVEASATTVASAAAVASAVAELPHRL